MDAISISFTLQHIAAQLTKQSDQVLQEQLGIGASQFRILHSLRTEPRTAQRDIAVNLGQTEASISRQVQLMIVDGLLQSARSPKDRREHITVLTPKGDRLHEAATAALAKYLHPMFAALSEKQLAYASQVFNDLHARVCVSEH